MKKIFNPAIMSQPFFPRNIRRDQIWRDHAFKYIFWEAFTFITVNLSATFYVCLFFMDFFFSL